MIGRDRIGWWKGAAGPLVLLVVGLLLVAAGCRAAKTAESEGAEGPSTDLEPPEWNQAELAVISRLWLGSLPPNRPDLSNSVADDRQAAKWGQQLFFDTRLSGNNQVACATCHQPERYFTDGLTVGQGAGSGTRNTPTLVGASFAPWFFWDGRRDSQWAQALSPLETGHEHDSSRLEIIHLVAEVYPAEYETIFGPLPDFSDEDRFPAQGGPLADAACQAAWQGMSEADRQLVNEVFANVGKALAAYQRRLLPGPAPFDAYAQALLQGSSRADELLSVEAQLGLQLFISRARCTNCHSGPLLDDNFFHNIGVPSPDPGREQGAPLALENNFNCLGLYSDAVPERCQAINEIRIAGAGLVGAFKTPSLRNVAETAPYMHNGQLTTLAQVLDHYNRAPEAEIGRSEIQPLNLTEAEMGYLEAFLRSLTGPPATAEEWLAAP